MIVTMTLVRKYKNILSSESTGRRFIAIVLTFFLIFYSMVILSHLFLPEGILRGKNSGDFFDTSKNIWISSLQILSWNMISVVILFVSSLFAYRKNETDSYISCGILCMITWAVIDGLTLGTNSFGVQRENMELMRKLISTFDLANHAGMWELVGLNCIASAFQQKSLILSTKKVTITKKISQLKFTRSDILFLVLGLALMIMGAIIESASILKITT